MGLFSPMRGPISSFLRWLNEDQGKSLNIYSDIVVPTYDQAEFNHDTRIFTKAHTGTGGNNTFTWSNQDPRRAALLTHLYVQNEAAARDWTLQLTRRYDDTVQITTRIGFQSIAGSATVPLVLPGGGGATTNNLAGTAKNWISDPVMLMPRGKTREDADSFSVTGFIAAGQAPRIVGVLRYVPTPSKLADVSNQIVVT